MIKGLSHTINAHVSGHTYCIQAFRACQRRSLTFSALPSLIVQVNLTAFENELGVQAPVGFWDPVGFTSDGDVATFKRRRSVELKHGRISMMATMGFLIAVHETSSGVFVRFADVMVTVGVRLISFRYVDFFKAYSPLIQMLQLLPRIYHSRDHRQTVLSLALWDVTNSESTDTVTNVSQICQITFVPFKNSNINSSFLSVETS